VLQLAASRVPKAGWFIDRLQVRACLRRLVAAGEIELVEAPEWQGVAWPAVGHVPTVLRFNGSSVTFGRLLGRKVRRSLRWLEQRGFAAAAGCVAVSRFIARETAADFGLSEAGIPVIPNAIDASRFAPPTNAARDDRLVACVGTVTEKKGVVELIRAWPRVVERFPDARLAVIGKDGRHTATGRSLIAVLREMLPGPAAATVTFTGPVPHACVQEWLRRAALAVYPTFVEALPVTWLEAMATATPIIGSCLGPGEELIDHGRSGLLCDPRDTVELASRIADCLRDPSLRARLGAAGRRQVEERFSTLVILPQNEAFYQRHLRGGIPVQGVPASRAASGAGSR
jgi:glycosyltransferase involved in cell wall biosynthesis